MVWVPCSRVGHVCRALVPYSLPASGPPDPVNTNHRRVVESWWDEEHRQYFYTRQVCTTLNIPLVDC